MQIYSSCQAETLQVYSYSSAKGPPRARAVFDLPYKARPTPLRFCKCGSGQVLHGCASTETSTATRPRSHCCAPDGVRVARLDGTRRPLGRLEAVRHPQGE